MYTGRGLVTVLVCVLNELHILFVPLLDILQQHLALVSLQLQGLHLSNNTKEGQTETLKIQQTYSSNVSDIPVPPAG